MQKSTADHERASLGPGHQAGIHASSLIAWGCYFLTFVATVVLSPAAADNMAGLGAGVGLLVAGIAAFFAGVFYYQRHLALELSNPHYGQPDQLVTSGPFALSRNPIYLTFLVPISAFAWYSPLAALVGAAVYIGIMTFTVIAGEERLLEAKFGDAFRDYKRRSPRWLLV
jgi:protein-S-isoprenylcysteine O-methyltransferase Ste14